jgi:hypothetical protein
MNQKRFCQTCKKRLIRIDRDDDGNERWECVEDSCKAFRKPVHIEHTSSHAPALTRSRPQQRPI